MAIQIQGNGGTTQDVGGTVFRAANIHVKPIEYASGAGGHYRAVHRCTLAATQAANSRIFSVRNTDASKLLIPVRMQVRVLQTAAGTAQAAGLDIFRCTSFSVVDSTNTVTPTTIVKRTSGMTAGASAIAAIRGVTVAGASAGTTGGTLTKDAGPLFSMTFNVTTAAVTNYVWGPYDVFDDVNGNHPFVFAQNEGFEIENRTLNTTSFGCEAIVDFSWAEVSAY